MAALKNQHFVPKCLLKPFSQDSKGRSIHLYNIRHDRLIPRAPLKGQCQRDYLYGKDGKLEHALGRIERSFGMTRVRVLDGTHTETDLYDLNFFTYLQLRRTEMAAIRLKDAYDAMSEGTFGLEKSRHRSNHGLVLESLHFCIQTRHDIEDLKIRIVENRTDVQFVISDDPAVMMNRYATQRLKESFYQSLRRLKRYPLQILHPPSSPFNSILERVVRCWHSNAYSSLFSSLFFFDPPNRFVQIPQDLS
jgi:hypothetical protein